MWVPAHHTEPNKGKPSEDGEPPKWTVPTLGNRVVHMIYAKRTMPLD